MTTLTKSSLALIIPSAFLIALTSATSPSCENTITTDVAIVGAGMAGVAAARRLIMEGFTDFVVLEASDDIGGRARSYPNGVGVKPTIPFGQCANWVYWFEGFNPVFDVAYDSLGLKMEYEDFYSYSVFDENGTQLDYDILYDAWDPLYEGLYKIGDMKELEFHPENRTSLPPDQGTLKELEDLGWTIDGGQDRGESPNFRKAVYWDALSWGSLHESVARLSRDPYDPDAEPSYLYFISDDRGFEAVVDKFWEDVTDLVTADSVLYMNTRVQTIHYDEPGDYSALVEATSSDGSCMNVRAKRVISTLPNAVMEKELVEFSPPLAYDTNPYRTGLYSEVYYQFEQTFWDNTTYFHMTFPEDPDGNECIIWKNMDINHAGSNMIVCYLVTKEFQALMDPETQLLSPDTMLKLLDPLRRIYGSDVVGTPIYMEHDKIHLDVNKGYAAYPTFKIGATPLDFAQFYGGIEDVTGHHGPGAHNGLNSMDEHILHISGADRCFNWRATVTGAFYAGEFTAIQVLESLGMSKNFSEYYPCDERFESLRGAIAKPEEPKETPPKEDGDMDPVTGDDDDSNDSLADGAIVALVIGGTVAMLLMCFLLFKQHGASASAGAGAGKPSSTFDEGDEEEASP